MSIGAGGFDDDNNAETSEPGFGETKSEGETDTGDETGNAEIVSGSEDNASGDPSMSDDGSRVFFESAAGLTPQALNDVVIGTGERGIHEGGSGSYTVYPIYARNVYEWESEGVAAVPRGSRQVAYI